MAVTRNMDARLEALEKAMEEQANHLTAIQAKLDERAAIQKSQFDHLQQQLAALGYLQPIAPIAPLAVLNTVVKPCITAPTTFSSCTTLHTSTPKNLAPVLVRLSAPASAAPPPAPLFAPKVSTSPLPPHQPFPLKQASPLLSIQQPTILP